MKHVLLVGGHDETFARFVGLPYRFSLIQLEGSLGTAQRDLASRIEVVPALAVAAVLEAARRIHADDAVDFLFSFTEDGLLPAATAAMELGVAGIDHDACVACIDKSVMRRRLEHTPYRLAHRHCDRVGEALEFFAAHPGGVVLKDPRGAGSRHVAVARTPAEVSLRWDELSGFIGPILVEEYIGGVEYSVETLSIRGRHEFIGITEKSLHPGTLIESQHVFPAPGIDPALAARIEASALGLLDAIGYRHGPCHIEVKVDDGQVRLIEINNRAGGDFIWELVWLTLGIDLFRESLEYAFEGAPDRASRAGRVAHPVAASRFFFDAQDQARVRAAIGTADIVRWHLDDGPVTLPVLDSDDRIGPVVIGCPSHDELRAALARIGTAGLAAAPAA